MSLLLRLWTLALSAKSARATVRKVVEVARQVQSTIGNTGTAEIQERRRRAELGDVQAQYDLGETYYTGAGVPQDFGEAARWFEMAAERGHAKAQTTLGLLYFLGRGVGRDNVRALVWIDRAAAKQDPAAKKLRATLIKRMTAEEVALAGLSRKTRSAKVETNSNLQNH